MNNNRSKPKHSGRLRAEDEWYVEPSWSVAALATVENLAHKVYDPACGGGTIPRTLSALGHEVIGTDLVDRGYGQVVDFLTATPRDLDADIVCNPPYLRGEGTIAFINRAVSANYRKACFIVNESFLFSRRRKALFEAWPLARIWFLSDRPSMPPGALLASGEVEAKGGTANYSWLVFMPHHDGPPTCGWVGKSSVSAAGEK